MKPKLVFVDWYGTLSNSTFWGHIPSTDPNLYPLRQAAEATLFGELSDLVIPWMKGQHTTEQIVSIISQKSSHSEEQLFSQFVLSAKQMIIDPEVVALVEQLRNSGTKVVIATDNMDSFARWTTPALNLTNHFDGILNSYEQKALKKDFDSSGQSLFFGNYLKENNLRPEECVLIDDSDDKNGNLQKLGIVYQKIRKSSELKNVFSSIISQ